MVNDILSFFGFESEKDEDKKMQVDEFINVLTEFNKIDHFNRQFLAYKKYKSITGEKAHGFSSFLGSNKKDFLNGGWNSENWEFKLNNIPIKTIKTDNQDS